MTKIKVELEVPEKDCGRCDFKLTVSNDIWCLLFSKKVATMAAQSPTNRLPDCIEVEI